MRARWQDVSGWQDPARMDYARWRGLGICAGQYRLTLGRRVDPRAAEHRAKMRAAGLLTGAYAVIVEYAPIREQVAALLANLPGDDELPVWLDAEREGVTEAMLEAWLDAWDELAGQRELWIYTGFAWWRRVRNTARYARYRLVIAAYPNDAPAGVAAPMDPVSVARRSAPPAGEPRVPAPWTEAAVWQYTGQGSLPGYDGFLDLSVYAGTEAELRARFVTEPVTMQARMKVGPQLNLEGDADATDWLARGRPAVAVGINIGPPGEIDGDGLIWVARNFEDTFQPQNPAAGGYSADPVEAARQYAASWYHDWLRLNAWIRFVAGPNEPVVGDSASAMRYLAAFHAELVRIIHEEYGRVAVVGNFAVGTPHYWLWREYRPALEAVLRYGAFHARHSYGERGLHEADYALRHRKDAEIFAAMGLPPVPTLLTEVGWESLPEVGQRAWGEEPRRSADEYAAHVAWLDDELRKDPDVAGASLFTYGHNWAKHNVNGSGVGRIAADRAELLPPAPVPLPRGVEMPYQVLITLDNAVSLGEVRARLGETNIFDLRVVVPVDNVPEPPKWWELWPEGLISPARKLAAPNTTITFYQASGAPFSPSVARLVTWQMDAHERRANLLRVTSWTDGRANWWVRAEDVEPL